MTEKDQAKRDPGERKMYERGPRKGKSWTPPKRGFFAIHDLILQLGLTARVVTNRTIVEDWIMEYVEG